jgi:Tol biopolymer transport system component
MRRPPITVPFLAGVLVLGLAVPAAAATTTRLSVRSNGAQGTGGYSDQPATAGSVRWVAFASGFANLVPGDTNGAGDIVVHDTATGKTTRVSLSSTEAQANDESAAPAISADGRYVAFVSTASNLVPGDTNGVTDVFVRAIWAETTRRVSLRANGGQANGSSDAVAIGTGRRRIVFRSYATNLVAGDTNTDGDIFLRIR